MREQDSEFLLLAYASQFDHHVCLVFASSLPQNHLVAFVGVYLQPIDFRHRKFVSLEHQEGAHKENLHHHLGELVF